MILRRIEDERFSEVLSLWEGKTAAVFGGGPSLKREQVAMVRAAGIPSIAVNAAYLWADFADLVFFADSHFERWQREGVDYSKAGFHAEQVRERWAAFAGQKCTVMGSGDNVTDPAVHVIRHREGRGLSLDPRELVTGRNSGFMAMNLAVLAGAKRVLLLGFDGKPGENGRGHWHGDHPRPTPEAAYPLYRQAMSAAENALLDAGVEVLNCSPGSAIDTFPRVELEDVLRVD